MSQFKRMGTNQNIFYEKLTKESNMEIHQFF
jgi:hypothetical protein